MLVLRDSLANFPFFFFLFFFFFFLSLFSYMVLVDSHLLVLAVFRVIINVLG